eukprot:m.345440 g.345440  ORF g.345440 m.345440 type:complete len:142 (+) comp19858_c0_seq31:96-521(+)
MGFADDWQEASGVLETYTDTKILDDGHFKTGRKRLLVLARELCPYTKQWSVLARCGMVIERDGEKVLYISRRPNESDFTKSWCTEEEAKMYIAENDEDFAQEATLTDKGVTKKGCKKYTWVFMGQERQAIKLKDGRLCVSR